MSENQAIVQAIQKLLHHPGNPWQEQLQNLLRRADAGEDITVEAIDLLSPNKNVRVWMREQVVSFSTRTYEPLAGVSPPIMASQQWVCPKKGCAESLPIIQEGEDAPTCPTHKVLMVRLKEKRISHAR
jgi:hypothetical protein